MNAVEEAARIAEARFAALATSVYAMDPITGDLAWKNNKIAAGQWVIIGWGFGTYDPATDSFTFMAYEVDGVMYICGSVLTGPAPAQGSSNTAIIQSYAPNVGEAVTFDAYCFIASGALSRLTADWGSGVRVIGFSWDDFQALSLIAVRVFEDVLAVSPYGGPALVTITVTNKNAPIIWKYSHDLFAGWNLPVYQGETTTVRNAVESIQPYLLEIGHYIGETYYEYSMDDIIEQNTVCWVNVSQTCTWGMPPKVEAPYWAGLTNRSIGSCPFTPINQDFNWTIYDDELVMFACYDATQHRIDTPNSGLFLGWGIFLPGELYTWNFATGQLEGQYKEGWIP